MYPWPGNVRELANAVQQMLIFCKKNTIKVNDLPPSLFLKESKLKYTQGEIELKTLLSDIEKKFIVTKLVECKGNQEQAARLLGVTRKMLANRIKKYEVEPLDDSWRQIADYWSEKS